MPTALKRPRGSRDLWLDAAYNLLISGGIEAVKVMPLAQQLNLTRTGFYWFFKDLSELHRDMLRRWEEKNTGNLVTQCNKDAHHICEALFHLMDCWLNPELFDSRLDLAVRNWARTNPEVKLRLDHADEMRKTAVTQMFKRFGYSPAQAEVRGMTVIYTQIGYISMEVNESHHERLGRVQHYVELFASTAPQPCHVADFIARHTEASIP
ncbi:MAG: TetR/AcrR family transcriptional regulator [Pelagimonas sp.]|nr:TetR/AcrR family transcriptional regulator [Pelagimonas sp.]